MPLPLIAAGVGVAGSLLGGWLNRRAINRSAKRQQGFQNSYQRSIDEITGQFDEPIEEFSERDYFLPLLQQLAGDATQGNYNINSQLAQQGIDSPMMAQELQQAGERRRAATIRQGVDAMEGQRLSMLNSLMGQRAGIASSGSANLLNARMGGEQNMLNARTSNTSQMISGVTGSVVQGIGAKISQNNFQQLMGQANQPVGAVNAGQVMGFGQNAYDSSLFGGGSFGSNLYG